MDHDKDPKPAPPEPPAHRRQEEKESDYRVPGSPERPRSPGGGGRPAIDPPDGNTTMSDI